MGFVRDFSDSIRLGFAKMLASQDVEVTDFGEVVDSKKMVEEANLSADQINMLKAAMQNSDTAGKDMNKKQAGSVVLHASDMVINARTKLGFLLKKGKANRRLREKLEGKIEVRLGNGLDTYTKDINTIIISGMGGRNIIGIFKNLAHLNNSLISVFI